MTDPRSSSLYAGDVPGLLAFGLGAHLDGEFGRVDEVVAPHAADPGSGQTSGGVDLPDATVRGDGDLHADSSGGDEELVDDGVDPVPGRMAVGGQEDPVACSAPSSRGRLVASNGFAVHEDEFPDAEPGKSFDDDTADTAEADEGDA
ncbi:hypothetical protein E4N62_24695 [Streptomyces sp. MNU76]|uniref:hypothetical protein n=1 Tax=Streptomyces sp. MNU76 TaxID=2560026 RepID=UPI001E4FE9F4|nr:hypothetical protein [Streptomyces sp. MNU76]MCC9708172.1 hypothetical protein [Streptomyces sp. MNU76]